jgi:hypothetical protein
MTKGLDSQLILHLYNLYDIANVKDSCDEFNGIETL